MACNLAGLDARVRRLEDIEKICRLRMLYHFLMNEGQTEDAANVIVFLLRDMSKYLTGQILYAHCEKAFGR